MMGERSTMMAEGLGHQMPLRASTGLWGKDFTSQVLRAKTAIVDAILLLDTVPEAVRQVRQMKEHRCNETTEARPFHIQQVWF
jgi:ABC-type branched-subunit amino acid transport system substrate-binding protein